MGRFFRVIRAPVRDPAMARVTIAFVAFVVAEYAVWIGMLVYAFGHGGATASGLVAFAQLFPGMLLAPVLATLADRRSPTRLLAGGYLVQALGMAGVAASLWSGAPRAELIPSSTISYCAYKGRASCWSVTVGGRLVPDLAWSYEEPLHEAARVRGLVAFFDERIDLSLDGRRRERPITPWSS